MVTATVLTISFAKVLLARAYASSIDQNVNKSCCIDRARLCRPVMWKSYFNGQVNPVQVIVLKMKRYNLDHQSVCVP
jgi:hypothetical protein